MPTAPSRDWRSTSEETARNVKKPGAGRASFISSELLSGGSFCRRFRAFNHLVHLRVVVDQRGVAFAGHDPDCRRLVYAQPHSEVVVRLDGVGKLVLRIDSKRHGDVVVRSEFLGELV